MSINPFDFPHDCERESVARALGNLSRQQRRVLRSYVRNVECGQMTLGQWIEDSPDSVAMSTWRRPAGQKGKYWGTDDDPVDAFREAARLYTDAWLQWETSEEEKALRKAGRELRLMAPSAVERLRWLMLNGESHNVQLRATDSILNRAALETAEKSSNEVVGLTLEEWRKQQAERRQQAGGALADFDDDDAETE